MENNTPNKEDLDKMPQEIIDKINQSVIEISPLVEERYNNIVQELREVKEVDQSDGVKNNIMYDNRITDFLGGELLVSQVLSYDPTLIDEVSDFYKVTHRIHLISLLDASRVTETEDFVMQKEEFIEEYLNITRSMHSLQMANAAATMFGYYKVANKGQVKEYETIYNIAETITEGYVKIFDDLGEPLFVAGVKKALEAVLGVKNVYIQLTNEMEDSTTAGEMRDV